MIKPCSVKDLVFLSTPSARRATSEAPAKPRCSSHFYPRPPRGGRLQHPLTIAVFVLFLSTPSARRATCELCCSDIQKLISIHALREEGDAKPTEAGESVRHFYPRPPRGGRPRLF